MAIQPDDSEYGGQTVTGAGWVHLNEDDFAAAKQAFDELKSQLRDEVIPSARDQMMKLVDAWDGAGSRAARDEASAIISEHEVNADAAEATAKQLGKIEASIVKAKNMANFVAAIVQALCEQIRDETVPPDGADTRSTRIAETIVGGYNENVENVATYTTELASNLGVPSGVPGADGKMPPAPPAPDDVPATPNGRETAANAPTLDAPPPSDPPVPASPMGWETVANAPTSSTPPPPAAVPASPAGWETAANAPNSDSPAPPPAAAPAPMMSGGPSGSSPSATSAGSGGLGGVTGSSPGSLGSSSSASSAGSSSSSSASGTSASQGGTPRADAAKAGAGATAAGQRSPFEAAAKAASGAQIPASAPLQPPAPAVPAQPPAAPAPPAAAAPMSGSSGGGGAATGVAGAAPAAPVPAAPAGTPMPLGPPPTPPPAAPVAPAGPIGSGIAPAAAAAGAGPAGAPAPVPVSARRAERDAIAAAAVAGALRRKTGGHDPLQLARQIAAALNAPQSIPALAWEFMWATGLTVDGKILVANTYGLAYLPEGVNLPAQVQMVTADESIPPSERAKWAAFPFLAVQGWAQDKNTRLQAVIGTEAQLAGIDPGARKVYLDEADIPEDGTMQGRSRLEVIGPGPAAKLAGTPDAALSELLPPPPVDSNPPEDISEQLWFDMLKPLMRSGTGREVAHLEAFITYAEHAQELALHRAHTATEAATQRAAIADWVYWQHVSVLTSDALTVPTAP